MWIGIFLIGISVAVIIASLGASFFYLKKNEQERGFISFIKILSFMLVVFTVVIYFVPKLYNVLTT